MNTLSSTRSSAQSVTYITSIDYSRLNDLIQEQRLKGAYDKTAIALAEVLRRSTKVPSDDILGTVVTMNSKVALEDLKTGTEKELSIVYPKAADIHQMKVSVLAPVAISLLGRKVGDVVEWHTPSGSTRYVVRTILYQPEAEGDFHL